jgi:hypothetical protein
MSLYNLVKPQVEVNKKIIVYDIIVNEYIKQIMADKTVFNITNETALERGITNKVIEVNAKKDEIKTYFDNTPINPVPLRADGFHELPALFVFDYLKTILLKQDANLKTRTALKTKFQGAILDRIPEQKDSLKVAVKNPIDTVGLPDTKPHLFKGVLYEVIAGDDKELLKMAHEEYLQTDMTPQNVINLDDTSFDIEGTSVEVDLVTKVDNSKKSSLERLKGAFKAKKRIPDYVRITTKKGDKTTIGILRIGSTFKLPQHKETLKVDSILGGTDEIPFTGIEYIIGDTNSNEILRIPTDQESGKQWIYLSKGLPPAPIKGGTRSKRRTPLEKKTRKMRGGLSVKMEE